MVESEDYLDTKKALHQKQEQNISVFNPKTDLNYDFFRKVSIFLKVSSGTHNLSREVEEECHL